MDKIIYWLIHIVIEHSALKKTAAKRNIDLISTEFVPVTMKYSTSLVMTISAVVLCDQTHAFSFFKSLKVHWNVSTNFSCWTIFILVIYSKEKMLNILVTEV